MAPAFDQTHRRAMTGGITEAGSQHRTVDALSPRRFHNSAAVVPHRACLRDLPEPGQAFTTFEQVRTPRAEKIIKQAARINNDKAATGAARVFRDAMMPVMMPLFLRFIANGRPGRQLYGHHIDWDAPTQQTHA